MKQFMIILIIRSLALLPWAAIQGLGSLIGKFLLRTGNRQKRDALINIRLCRSELSPSEQEELRRASIIHFAKTYIEMSALWLWPAERVLSMVVRETGTELLNRDDGRGVIVLSPHLGAWELAGLFVPTKGPSTTMYRPQKHLDGLILKGRQRNGARLVPDNVSGVKHMLRAVKSGEYVGILPDQVTREETGSIFSPFFGVPAVTMLLVARLARRSGARVVFLFAERLPGGQGFHMHCLPAPEGIDSSDDSTAAAALNRGVEQCIAICPEQYQWTYRRFRRRPGGEDSPYRGPSI